MCDCVNCNAAKEALDVLLFLNGKYAKLLNSLILDFFAAKHWEALPKSWQALDTLQPHEMAQLLRFSTPCKNATIPLAILCLRKIFAKLCLRRETLAETGHFPHKHFICHGEVRRNPPEKAQKPKRVLNNDRLRNNLFRGVKPKKRHEISAMAEVFLSKLKEFAYILDIGSGLGHLMRNLAYEFGLNVCGVEVQERLMQKAKLLDEQFARFAGKCDSYEIPNIPVHLNLRIDCDLDAETLLKAVRNAFGNPPDFSLGLVGLHPCGDLGPYLIEILNKSPDVKFLTMAGCCYMKLTTTKNSKGFRGYPISRYISSRSTAELDYYAREMSCHALETYIDRLLDGQYSDLKVHAFRAALECLIVRRYPEKKHMGLGSVKYCNKLRFEDYCRTALAKSDICLSENEIATGAALNLYGDWYRVVIFYSLRLMFASMVETVILLDRYLYATEQGHNASIWPLFDPKVSPRNHVLTVTKQV